MSQLVVDQKGRVTSGTSVTISGLNVSAISAGTLPIAQGGTGLGTAPSAGEILLASGTGTWTLYGCSTNGHVLTWTTGTGFGCAPSSSQWTTNGANVYYNTGNVGVGTTAPHSTLQVSGSIAAGLATKSTDYTLTAADNIVLVDATGGPRSLTLPTAVGISGRQYTIKKTDSSSNAVAIATTSAQTIDGTSSQSLTLQSQFFTLVSDGANWQIIGAMPALANGSGTPSFSITDLTDQPLSSLVASSASTVTGFTGTLVATVTGAGGPEISINGGAWTTSGGIQAGQTIQARLTTSGTVSTVRTAVITVGSVSDNWDVSTRAAGLKIFATANLYLGSTLGGISGADAICQAEAGTAGFTGSYKAILSTSTTNANARFTMSYPVVNASNGSTVSAINLWSGSLSTGIKKPDGNAAWFTWTGSNADGSKAADTCSDWTSSGQGRAGHAAFTDTSWLYWGGGTHTCQSDAFHLYCLQQ